MKKKLGVLALIIVGAVGFLTARVFIDTAAAPGGIVVDQVADGFKYAVQQVRPTLPKKVDDATTLTDVSSTGMVMTYHYVVDGDDYELLPNFMEVSKGKIIGLVCNTQEMKAAMEAGAVYEFNYSDENSKPLGGYVVTSADCR